jgi:hypothetical protein
MDRTLILLLASCFMIGSARAELQLNPSVSEFTLDGAKLSHLVFSDGSGKDIFYSPPRGWKYSGSGSKLTLQPANKQKAEATITRMALPQPTEFDDETTKRLTEEALVSVPKGCANAQIVSQEKSPLRINRKETLLVIVSYDLYGETFSRSILFMNRPGEQLRFQLTCLQADFSELQKAFLGSQYSWQNL